MSTPATTAACSDQMMEDGVGRLWTSLGQSPGLQMAWRRLPVFRSDMERRSAVVSLIVADRSHPTALRSVADVTFIHAEKQMSRDADAKLAAVIAQISHIAREST